MPVKSCPQCKQKGSLETDMSAGTTVCTFCGYIVESGVLVTEVGFAEGNNGKVHVQGTFVAFGATGVSGFRGSGGSGSYENVKLQGHERINRVAEDMVLGVAIRNGARATFGLAVDNRFNRGRRTDYLVASCLYLQCRIHNDHHMLIDFSSRLKVNVYDLATTYLKLGAVLNITRNLPQVDPIIYNLHFAKRLDFGPQTNAVAADASKLIRRFKADWMTQGRRPAGVCGACLIIAGRMNNFLRTPEEVGQVVKCSPYTIRKRLREFAETEMAKKTVAQVRTMTEQELDEGQENVPPIVKEQRNRAAKLERQRLREEGLAADQSDEEDELAEDDHDDDDVDEEGRPRKRRKSKSLDSILDPEDVNAALVAAVQGLDGGADGSGLLAGDDEAEVDGDDDDRALPEMEAGDYLADVSLAGEDPEAARARIAAEAAALKRRNKKLFEDQQLEDDAADIAEGLEEDLPVDPDVEEYDDGEKEEGAEEKLEEYDYNEEEAEDEGEAGEDGGEGEPATGAEGRPRRPKPEAFHKWDDEEEVIKYLVRLYFADEAERLNLDQKHVEDRARKWLSGRSAREVVQDIMEVDRARRRWEEEARRPAEVDLGLTPEEEEDLDRFIFLDEEDRQVRARLWISENGKWLEESKKRAEDRALYNKQHGIDPNKPRQKRKRGGVGGTGGQGGAGASGGRRFGNVSEAIASFAQEKKFSSRINYAMLNQLGVDSEDHLQKMADDDKMEDEKDDYRGDDFSRYSHLIGQADDDEDDGGWD